MTIKETARKIKKMEVRGASDIAKATTKALREKAKEIEPKNVEEGIEELKNSSQELKEARPTAVSLPNAINKTLIKIEETNSINELKNQVISNSNQFLKKIREAKEEIGEIGSKRIKNNSTVLTHCNSEAALSVIKEADKQKEIEVYATESRPRYQGRITAKKLSEKDIEVTQIIDSAARYFMNEIDLVIVGADAIGANGALANKIGTSQIALAAKEARVNFLVAAETYKFSPKTVSGELIEIEERDSKEVWEKPPSEEIQIRNPAFDFTPPEYIDNIITENGLISPHMAYFVLKEEFGWKLREE